MDTGRAPQVESHQNDYKPRGPQGAPSLVNKRNREERKRLGLKKNEENRERERGKELDCTLKQGTHYQAVSQTQPDLQANYEL